MDINSVITLGKLLNLALIPWTSELSDGLEPHGHIEHRCQHARYVYSSDRQGRGVPGVVQAGGYQEVLYRVLTQRPA